METAHFLLTHNPQEMVPTNLNDSTVCLMETQIHVDM